MDQEQYLQKGLEIVHLLRSFTYDAYLIGGAVRDYLLNQPFMDIDIATSANPEEVMKIFPHARSEYQHLGVIVLKIDEMVFEINTFKKESYSSPRIPEQVEFVSSLADDVARRDFTINALAMSDLDQITDLVGGLKDLQNHTIRIIGSPFKRFKEDPLRIMRAYDLMARFNFHLSFSTRSGIVHNNQYLPMISNYQISKSIDKIFNAPFGKKALKKMISLCTHEFLNDYRYGLKIVSRNFKRLTTTEKLALCFVMNKNGQIPDNTCFDKALLGKINAIMEASKATKDYVKNSPTTISEKDVFNFGEDLLLSATKINHLIYKNYPNYTRTIKKLAKSLPINSMSELKFHGSDLVQLNNGIGTNYIKDIMDELASEVVLGMLSNDYNVLKERAMALLKQIDKLDATIETEEPVDDKPEKPADHDFLVQPSSPLASEMAQGVNSEEEITSDALIKLKVHYDLEFDAHVKEMLASFLTGNETEEEKETLTSSIKSSVKDALLSQNPEYHILKQKGLI